MSSDEKPRLLAQRPEQGYTASSAAALRGEPEAVSQAEQARQTAEAKRRDDALRAHKVRVYARELSRIEDEVRSVGKLIAGEPLIHSGAARELQNTVRSLTRAINTLKTSGP